MIGCRKVRETQPNQGFLVLGFVPQTPFASPYSPSPKGHAQGTSLLTRPTQWLLKLPLIHKANENQGL
ncbi:hypothetical protein [Nostoc sp.]|uniref:hypothetical protein n=1 Tax=Nostoc sp. TaxID=1180 RepID=UPI002FFCE15F